MPTETGLEFIKERLDHGCKINYRALMSADWSDPDMKKAQELGCRIFHKPFNLDDLVQWLNDCVERIDTNRKLSDWFNDASLNSEKKASPSGSNQKGR